MREAARRNRHRVKKSINTGYTIVLLEVIPKCGCCEMVYVTMGPKGQVVIPKHIRDDFGMEPGDELLVNERTIEGHKKVVVEKRSKRGEEFIEFLNAFRSKHAGKNFKFDADKSYDGQMRARFGHHLKKTRGRR